MADSVKENSHIDIDKNAIDAEVQAVDETSAEALEEGGSPVDLLLKGFNMDEIPNVSADVFHAYSKPFNNMMQFLADADNGLMELLTLGQRTSEIAITGDAYQRMGDTSKEFLSTQFGVEGAEFFEGGETLQVQNTEQVDDPMAEALPVIIRLVPGLLNECYADMKTLALLQSIPPKLIAKAVDSGTLSAVLKDAKNQNELTMEELGQRATTGLLTVAKAMQQLIGGVGKSLAAAKK